MIQDGPTATERPPGSPAASDPHLDLDRGERASIVLRADLTRVIDCTAVAKGILHVLDAFPPDRCYPSEETIARCACTSVRTVRRALRSLIGAGLVETRTRRAKSSRYRSSRYYVVRYDILGGLDYRARSMVEPGAAPAKLTAPAPNRASPGQICAPAPAKLTANNKQEDNRIVKASKRTAADVRRELQLGDAIRELTPTLIRLGVARNRVAALVVEAGSRERVLEVLDLLEQRSRKRRIGNPGGYIAQAIREGWTPAGAQP